MHFKDQGQARVLFCILFRTTEPGPPFLGSFMVINHKMPSDSLQYQAVTFKVYSSGTWLTIIISFKIMVISAKNVALGIMQDGQRVVT